MIPILLAGGQGSAAARLLLAVQQEDASPRGLLGDWGHEVLPYCPRLLGKMSGPPSFLTSLPDLESGVGEGERHIPIPGTCPQHCFPGRCHHISHSAHVLPSCCFSYRSPHSLLKPPAFQSHFHLGQYSPLQKKPNTVLEKKYFLGSQSYQLTTHMAMVPTRKSLLSKNA